MGAVATRPVDLLRIADLSPADLQHLLELSDVLRDRPWALAGSLAGRSVACYFAKPSTRTRVSFEAAVHRLEGLPIMLRPDELQLGRGEPLEDTARVLASYCSAIVVRTFAQREVEALAAASDVPVVNALTDDHHPCQALADLLTLRRHFGRLQGLRIAYIGDGSNVCHSLVEAAALAGAHVAVAAPEGYAPDAAITAATGAEVHDDPARAVRGAHAVYTDVWVSMGDEADAERRRRDLQDFQVTPELLAQALPEAVFLHCLPAHRGEEVAATVIDGPQSLVWEQAANRLPTEQAVLHALVTGWGGA
ncbi:ornithine carbamoyltransferase [Conexibacter sp. SYSU D00693]|uniref:ornithine carbamoyltransferase n=1 Tax=Conexibacter sp. SYSU D00693 TaxID=2812560 RepID=UPI00196A497F|nr:ornithine carbamoyltransferase [Conexibacter sp. SYSU D00693]